MDKKALRQDLITQLKTMSPQERTKRNQRLTEQFLTSSAYQTCRTLALFLSMDFEFDTRAVMNRAQKDGKIIYIPKTYPQGQMTFLLYNEANLSLSKFGVMEPSQGDPIEKNQIDLIVVPGLGWNKQGYRIGFGGGFYDRYLSDYSGRTLSLAYQFQAIDFREEAHDIAVQEVIYDME